MDSSIERNRGTANAVQGKEQIRAGADQRQTRGALGERQAQRSAAATAGTQRLSVDPLRATDRYRLVLPIDERP